MVEAKNRLLPSSPGAGPCGHWRFSYRSGHDGQMSPREARASRDAVTIEITYVIVQVVLFVIGCAVPVALVAAALALPQQQADGLRGTLLCISLVLGLSYALYRLRRFK